MTAPAIEEALRIATAPYSAAQVEKATALIASGGLTPHERPGLWKARSSDKKRYYTCSALLCECPSRVPCAHMCAVALVETWKAVA